LSSVMLAVSPTPLGMPPVHLLASVQLPAALVFHEPVVAPAGSTVAVRTRAVQRRRGKNDLVFIWFQGSRVASVAPHQAKAIQKSTGSCTKNLYREAAGA